MPTSRVPELERVTVPADARDLPGPFRDRRMVEVRFADTDAMGTLREPSLCAWTAGMLEQLVVLSGGKMPTIAHDSCEARGDDACAFDVRGDPSEQS